VAGEARFMLAPLALADAGPAGSPAVQLFAEPRVLRDRTSSPLRPPRDRPVSAYSTVRPRASASVRREPQCRLEARPGLAVSAAKYALATSSRAASRPAMASSPERSDLSAARCSPMRPSARRRCSAGYVSNDARDARQRYPEDERLQHLSDEARAVVSEPLADLPGRWREVPPSSAVIVRPGDDQEVPFTPHAPD
jgi:hypothetical protein